MTRLAIKEFVKRQLELIDQPVPLAVYTQQPKAEDVGQQSLIFITIVNSTESRVALTYNQGMKKILHDVAMGIIWVADEAQSGGDNFDSLLELIDTALRNAQPAQAVVIIDPFTGQQSNLAYIAQEIKTTVDPPELNDTLGGQIVFRAVKTVSVDERITA